MKVLLLTLLMSGAAFSLENDKEVSAVDSSPASSSEAGFSNSSGITTDQMNTSPNPAPETEQEMMEESTLSTEEFYEVGPYNRDGNFDFTRPVEEEDSLDYSTTPE